MAGQFGQQPVGLLIFGQQPGLSPTLLFAKLLQGRVQMLFGFEQAAQERGLGQGSEDPL